MNFLTLNIYGETTMTWRLNGKNKNYTSKNNNNWKKKEKGHSKTLITRTPRKLKTNPDSLSHLYPPSVPLPHLQLQTKYDHSHAIPQNSYETRNPSTQTTLLVEAFHEKQRLKSLLEKLRQNGSNPLQILNDDGDWNKHLFWTVIGFLKNSSRSKEIPQVFDVWKNLEKSRINEYNYKNIINILGEEGLIEEAASVLQEMKGYGLRPYLETYNLVIHGFARKAKFDDALFFLNEMEEINLPRDTETYNGLIEAYGNCKLYDEIGMCVKKMESDGVLLDYNTYNLLIREFSRGGLLTRMEKVFQTALSKRMELHPSTLIAMLEVYGKFSLVEKMEKVYRRVLNSRATLDDDLMRKLACVYIENHMFSRLDDLGLGLSSKTGTTDLVWCLRLLSNACLLSRDGMDSIVGRMEEAEVKWNTNVANIFFLAYMKMKDFKHLRELLLELPIRQVEPDIVTVGILFDAVRIGFDGTGVLNSWRRKGFLARDVEMNTDPLVLAAFGKGHFMQSCEEGFSSLEPKDRERKTWTYQGIIDLVFEQKSKQPQVIGVESTQG